MDKKDSLGDRMKEYEMAEAGRKAMIGIPLLVRLDGKGFHKYTKGMSKPYDERLTKCLIDTTKMLVKDTNALVGYCQSDEISLLYYAVRNSDVYPPCFMYDGRFQKVTSILAGMTSSYFSRLSLESLPDHAHKLPVFDARAWQVPSESEAANAFYWRELDATKNAISMAAHAYFSHKELQGLSGADKQEMLFSRKGINFNDYPAFFKRGVYVKRKNFIKTLSSEELAKIPDAKKPVNGEVVRTGIVEMEWPAAKHVSNFKDLLFGRDVEPVLK